MIASSGQTSRSGSHGSSRSRPSSSETSDRGLQEPDAGADPVAAARAGAEPVGEPLGQPALDAPGGHHHDLLGERVVQRRREQLAERVGEQVGARCPVQVKRHGATLGGRADTGRAGDRNLDGRIDGPECDAPGGGPTPVGWSHAAGA